MIGIRFDEANPFNLHMEFNACNLEHSSFFGVKLVKASFSTCRLQHVEFENAQLKEVNFTESDLLGAHFLQTNLEKANFVGATNYQLDPDQNIIKGAKFSMDGLPGLLQKFKIKIVQ